MHRPESSRVFSYMKSMFESAEDGRAVQTLVNRCATSVNWQHEVTSATERPPTVTALEDSAITETMLGEHLLENDTHAIAEKMEEEFDDYPRKTNPTQLYRHQRRGSQYDA